MVLDEVDYAIVALAFLLAGVTKGVLGLGLPTVALAILAISHGLQPAMALILMPSFVTHLWRAVAGGHAGAILARHGVFILAATVVIWFGVNASYDLRMWTLMALLGFTLVAYAITGLLGWRLSLSRRSAIWAGLPIGVLTGLLTGLIGAFEAPGAWYVQVTGLSRNRLAQAVAMLGIASVAGLAVSLRDHRLLTNELAMVSAIAVVPAVIGAGLGRRLRKKIPVARFRRLYFFGLLAVGLYMLSQSL